MIRKALILLTLLSLLSCAGTDVEQVEDDSRRYIKVDDIDLYYGISIPDTYESEKPVPLILSLHYGGNFSDYYGVSFTRQLIGPGLEQLGAIIISPTCPSSRWTNERSEKAVAGLIEYILKEYSIDEKRILVTGFSLGGEGAWHYAAKFPDLFSISIPIAGPIWRFTPEFLNEIKAPMYVIHSRKDETVPFEEVEEMVNLLSYEGLFIEFRILEDLYHYNVSNYTPYLQEAVPWIYSQWDINGIHH